MARHGLGRVDLNQRACLALMGLTESPEADIAALLRSPQPIEPVTRAMLASALEGKSASVSIRLSRGARAKGIQKFRKRLDRLQAGRLALREIEARGYDEAVKAISKRLPTSEKSVESHIALARKVDAWIGSIRDSHGHRANLQDRDLEMAYLYADAFGQSPDHMIKVSLSVFTKLIAHLQDLLSGKALLGQDWMKA